MFEHILLPEPKGEALTILVNAYKAAISAPKPNLAERAFLTALGKSFGAKRATDGDFEVRMSGADTSGSASAAFRTRTRASRLDWR